MHSQFGERKKEERLRERIQGVASSYECSECLVEMYAVRWRVTLCRRRLGVGDSEVCWIMDLVSASSLTMNQVAAKVMNLNVA